MSQVEYLDREIAGEGLHADAPIPNSWMDGAGATEEYQPDIEPPHINDYAAFKKHKHYRQYFRPHVYQPFPAWLYHPTQEPKLVAKYRETKNGWVVDIEACKAEVAALGPEWSPIPVAPRKDMTGKSLPIKTETQKLAEVMAQAVAAKQGAGPIDASTIAAIVAATVAAINQKPVESQPVDASEAAPAVEQDVERTALIELADKDGVKIDKRWSNQRIKEALGLL